MAAVDLYFPLAYTPEPNPALPEPPPDPEPQLERKECSVRGCHQKVPTSAHTKMCEGCRGRHRVYATTKRMKRKLEKATLQNIVGKFVNQSATGPGMNGSIQLGEGEASPLGSAGQDHQNVQGTIVVADINVGVPSGALGNGYAPKSWSNPSGWDAPIDPRLFESSLTVPAMCGPQYHSSSELANALTLPVPSLYCRPDEAVVNSPDSTSHQPATAPAPANPSGSPEELSNSHQEAADGLPSRYCSVKGCKAVIPGSYEFKMCPPCRNRYRGYGTTKRRKWKAERDAFDRDLASMRDNEDERRKEQGLPPMAENSEELRLWEMSVLDEQISLPAEVVIALEAAGIRSDGKMNVPSVVDGNDDIVEHFAKVAEKVSSTTGSELPTLSARMCTVSHCHKILPGYYRYKRCEQHRLQNRHHSKLKRVREKVVKALGPEGGVQTIPIDPALRSRSASLAPEEEVEGVGQLDEGSAPLLKESTPAVSPPPEGWESKKARRPLSCTTEGCQNLLPLEKRWKRCDLCRLTERRRKADERKTAPGKSVPTQGGKDDVPESATSSCATAKNHCDNGERANHVALFPQVSPHDSRVLEERQRSRSQHARGDTDTSSGAVQLQVQPDVEMNSHIDQTTDPSPRQPFNTEALPSTSVSAGPLSTSTHSHQPNDAGLRMVNLTAHAYTNSAVPFSWANATAGAKSSYPYVADMPASAHLWNQEGLRANSSASDDSTSKALAPSTLTFKEYHPTKEPTKVPSPGISRFLARHPNVTVEAYKAFLEQSGVREQGGIGAIDNGAAVSSGNILSATITDDTVAANGKQIPASIASGAPIVTPSDRFGAGSSGGSAAASSATPTNSNAEPQPTSASTSRLDIARVATSTAESFRYYTRPPGSSDPDCAAPSAQAQLRSIAKTSTTHAATEDPTPVPSVSEASPQPAAKPATARKRKSKEAIDGSKVSSAVLVAPSVPANVIASVSSDSSAPSAPKISEAPHATTQLSGGYPTYPIYVTQPAIGAFPYTYPALAMYGQSRAGSYSMWIPAASSPAAASYTHLMPAPYAMTFPSHGGSATPSSTLPYPYNTYMPAQSTAPSSSTSTDGQETPGAPGTQGSPRTIHPSVAPRTRTSSGGSGSEKTVGSKDSTRFAYYHPGIGTSDSPDPDDAAAKVRKKRRTVDPAWLEKMRHLQYTLQQPGMSGTPPGVSGPATAPSMHVFSFADPAPCNTSPPASSVEASSISPLVVAPVPPLPNVAPMPASEDSRVRRSCHGKSCSRTLPSESTGNLCDRCKAKLKKVQEKIREKHKLVPYKSIVHRIGNQDIVRLPSPLTPSSS
ncbi:hypothetical protein BKA70DRAFT_1426714 [Coprinopsis sp. MPI-PUGE-AT-0042]|nr:hypothetical protein BKA70DRAFT_1426714 [Coprinopsis sp. MPI-PUGE-AT-0042]